MQKLSESLYIGETGHSFGVRMKEHWKKVELHEGKKYTRSTRKQSQSEQNKSAITDHVNTENHIVTIIIYISFYRHVLGIFN